MSRSKTPTANASVRTDGLDRDGQAERFAEDAGERSDTKQTREPCFHRKVKAGRSVGSRGMFAKGDDTPHTLA